METITEHQYNEAKRIIKLYKHQLELCIYNYSNSDINLPIKSMRELNTRMFCVLKYACGCQIIKDVLLIDPDEIKNYRHWGKACNDLLVEIQKKYNANG